MRRFLRRLTDGVTRLTSNRKSSPITRTVRPQVEGMEERVALSATSVMARPIVAPIHISFVPNLTGDRFGMISVSNGTKHSLLIQTESRGLFTGSFTGKWDGGAAISNGQLVDDANGVHISFTWGNGSHSFDGELTAAGSIWDIDGNVTVTGGGGPGHVVGQQNLVPDLTAVNFSMTSLTNGTSHSLKIQSETLNADGTASFTGLWDNGAAISNGKLSQDAQGTHVTFTWGNGTHSFNGHISFGVWVTPGSGPIFGRIHFGWKIDGFVTVQGGGGPGHVVGHQA